MIKKVYCQDCKYYYFPNIDGSSIHEYCKATETTRHTPIRSYQVMLTCEEAHYNKKNKCKLYIYKRKWWKFWIK